nr:unnamed protein product [Callosobruchus analis]
MVNIISRSDFVILEQYKCNVLYPSKIKLFGLTLDFYKEDFLLIGISIIYKKNKRSIATSYFKPFPKT